MDTAHLHLLFKYNYWAHDRILETAGQLAPNQLNSPSLPDNHTILSTLSHMLNAESLWRNRIENPGTPPRLIFDRTPESLAEIKAAWKDEAQMIWGLLNRVTTAELNHELTYAGLGGRSFKNQIWQILLQLINHGVAHRSEVALILTKMGHSPGNLDFIIFIRE